jgi:hypothetical protein
MNEKPDNLDPELLLTQYLDGQLGADQRRQVQRQLETDADLLAQAKLYEALDQQLDALSTAQVPGVDYDLQRQQIMESIERKMLIGPRPAVSLVFRPVFRVAAIAATAVIAVSLYLHFAPRPPTGPAVATPSGDSLVQMAVSHMETPNGGSIEVGISRPDRIARSQVSVESFPAKLDELALAGPHDQQVAQAPAGTVVASFDRLRADRATADAVFMFPPTESSADSGDIK